MPMQVGTLSDGTVVKIELKFLLTIMSAVIAIVIIFIVLRQDVVTALDRLNKHDIVLEQNAINVNSMKMQLLQLDDKISGLRDLYEYDRNVKKLEGK